MLGNDNNTAIAFPGAGVEITGKESGFINKYIGIFKPLFEKVSEYINKDFMEIVSDGDLTELTDRENQFFTIAFSTGYFYLLKEIGVEFRYVTGYSLGVYSALIAANVIDYDNGLFITSKAYELMINAAGKNSRTGMCAVIGLKTEELESIINNVELDSVYIVNSNNETCKVTSGNIRQLNILIRETEAAGAIKSVLLNVDMPYHHPIIFKDCSEKFLEILKELNFSDPGIPVISTINQNLLEKKNDIIEFAARHLSNPINWEKTAEKIYSFGIETIIECGPGISLTQNGRFINPGIKYINIKNINKHLGL